MKFEFVSVEGGGAEVSWTTLGGEHDGPSRSAMLTVEQRQEVEEFLSDLVTDLSNREA